ncbi:TetR/AcrR family transcriptional regulator [[Mycobacterium] appelbergii]|uniref:TetR/AcrR family transcriptional regulator n=1 Tax=[Mycobacterium] appelbergii TaxID=2939269 RepID=UPI00397768E3
MRRATDLFIRQGYDTTSISDLAKDLGVSKSAIFHHFDGKEAILAAALDEALDGLDQVVTEARDPGYDSDAYRRLRDTVATPQSVRLQDSTPQTLSSPLLPR